jgi:hypothetical protein
MTDSAVGTDADESEPPTDANDGIDAADVDSGDDVDAADVEPGDDGPDGAGWLAAEMGSVVSASVAFALYISGSTAAAIPGGTTTTLVATFWMLALAAAAAAGKARVRGNDLRVPGHGTLAVGLVLLAAGGNVALLAVGGLTVTLGTVGVVVAVAGANLVVLDVVR